MSAYARMKTAIENVLPEGWKLIDYEPVANLPDVTSVTLKVRTITRLPAAPIGAYQVDWILTVTSSKTSRQTADPALYDDLIDFLAAIDGDEELVWMAWVGAEKTVGDDDERLAYDITVRTHTTKEEA